MATPFIMPPSAPTADVLASQKAKMNQRAIAASRAAAKRQQMVAAGYNPAVAAAYAERCRRAWAGS